MWGGLGPWHYGMVGYDGEIIEHNGKEQGCVRAITLDQFLRGRVGLIDMHPGNTAWRRASVAWAYNQVGRCDYDLMDNNCESFVHEAIYGVRRSMQSEAVRQIAQAACVALVIGALAAAFAKAA